MAASQIIGMIASIVAMLASCLAAFVALYVRAEIGPIVERLKAQAERLADTNNDVTRVWVEIGKHGEKIARLEATQQCTCRKDKGNDRTG